eukprot:403357243
MESTSQIDREIQEFTSQVRTDPTVLLPHLDKLLKSFRGNVMYLDPRCGIQTNEGPAAVQEAIDFVKSVTPIGGLSWNDQLAQACKSHVEDIGPKGLCQHESSTGETLSQKIEKITHQRLNGMIGENISFGESTAVSVVASLIIDDGVEGRGHRENIYTKQFTKIGCHTGPHSVYETMTCMVFSS